MHASSNDRHQVAVSFIKGILVHVADNQGLGLHFGLQPIFLVSAV
jgi:hypothetical protein